MMGTRARVLLILGMAGACCLAPSRTSGQPAPEEETTPTPAPTPAPAPASPPTSAPAAPAETLQTIQAVQLEAADLSTGDEVIVTGRYKELFDRELMLAGCSARFTLASKDLVKEMLDYKANRDNVAVEGVVTATLPKLSIQVRKIWRAAPDTQVFARDLKGLVSRTTPDWESALTLLQKMMLSYEGYADPALEEQIAILFERMPEGGAGLSQTEVRKWAEAIQRLHSLVRKKGLTVAALSMLERAAPGDPEVLTLLQQLQTRKYKGRWVTQEEFKELEGYVQHQDRLVLPREKNFVEAILWYTRATSTDLILRRRTDPEYRVLADKGSLEVGMTPEETVRAIGFADRVEKRSFQQKEYVQWIYADRFLYFQDGILYRIAPRV